MHNSRRLKNEILSQQKIAKKKRFSFSYIFRKIQPSRRFLESRHFRLVIVQIASHLLAISDSNLLASRNRELCPFISFPRLHDSEPILYGPAASFARDVMYISGGEIRELGCASTCSSAFLFCTCIESIVIMEGFQGTLISEHHLYRTQ